jgi:hypothetical protein
MDEATIKICVKNFKNKSNTDSYLIMVSGHGDDYLTGQEFCYDTGPGTNRELVGIKQADGSVHFMGELKDYGNTNNN